MVDATPQSNQDGNVAAANFYKAVVFLASATVVGGSNAGQLVLSGSQGLQYYTPYSNGLIAVAGGNNAIGLGGSGNLYYGGSGNDTVGISGTDTVYAGTGSTLISFASNSAPVVHGSTSATAALTVQGGNVTATVDGGSGTLKAYDASGSYTGGTAGNNVISADAAAAAVKIFGGGANDMLISYSAGSEIHAVGNGTTAVVQNTNETVFGGAGTTSVNVMAGANGTAFLQRGSGATTVNVGSGLVSVTGGSGAITYLGGTQAATIVGGTGAVNATVAGGSVTGGTGAANVIVATGSMGATLTGGHDGDYIQAGSGNASLVAGTDGTEALVAGSGQDTLVATTTANHGTLLEFNRVSGLTTAQTYIVQNFATTGYSQLIVANATDQNYVLSHQTISGADTIVKLNQFVTIDLKNSTVALTTSNVKTIS